MVFVIENPKGQAGFSSIIGIVTGVVPMHGSMNCSISIFRTTTNQFHDVNFSTFGPTDLRDIFT